MWERAPSYREALEMSDYVWTGLVCLLLLIYLLYALLKPEKF
jgi:K+-transporting ATPase KdpF subunit